MSASPARSASYGGSHSPRSRTQARDTPPSRNQSQSSVSSTRKKSGNSSSYFTFPVTYSVNGLLRRFSGDNDDTRTAPRSNASQTDSLAASLQSLSSSTSAFVASAGSTLSSAAAAAASSYAAAPQQPQRRLSPFQPPPLTPLTLTGWTSSTQDKSKLLTRALAEEIRLLLPARLQLVPDWHLAFSLEQDGVSLGTLYKKCDEYRGRRGAFVLVVKDAIGGEFGAYLTDVPHPAAHYYGTGECFLWRASVLPAIPDMMNLPPPPSADTTNATRMTTLGGENIPGDDSNGNGTKNADGSTTPDRIRFKAFPYSGINDYMIFCETRYMSVGGGDGHYGLWLDDSLEKGISQQCPTFGNEPLSDEGSKFNVLGVEMWHIG